MGKKTTGPTRTVTVEITRNHVSMIVLERTGGKCLVRGHHLDWLGEAGTLSSEEGRCELTATLGALVGKEKLAGVEVHLALSSDFCVTRVLAGDAERVAAELKNLRERVSQYLLLGPGEKAIAESSRSIDAKQVHAWLTVTNVRILDNVVRAVHEAGLQVGLIEHAMLAMCRAVGRTGRDTEAPVIIADVSQRGVDLGISYQGQLLFDYRPGGVAIKEKLAEIIQKHLQRIQRYCDRQFPFAQGRIAEVLIRGWQDDLEPIQRQFSRTSGLSAEVLEPRRICSEWEYERSVASDLRFFSAIGSALVEPDQLKQEAKKRGLPNLMDYYRSAQRAPLLPTLVKAAWPIAAPLLLAAGIYGAALLQNRQIGLLEQQKLELDDRLAQLRAVKLEAMDANLRIQWLSRIDELRSNPGWHKLLAMVGQCKPEGVWLNSVRVEFDRTLAIEGPSQNEDLIFEFVKYLKKVPVLQDVVLESQRPSRTPRGPVILFDIKCRYTGEVNLSERIVSQ